MQRQLILFSPKSLAISLALGALAIILPVAPGQDRQSDDPNDLGVDVSVAQLERLYADWERITRQKMADDPVLRKLGGKYPPVILHSRRYLKDGSYGKCAYDFINKTADEKVHKGRVQLQFDNGRGDNKFTITLTSDQENLLADLGDVDFTKDPDLKKIDLDGDGLNTWDPKNCQAVDGHVYVERVRDKQGNRFYVLFKVITVDKTSRYIAFIWRMLPGAVIVKSP